MRVSAIMAAALAAATGAAPAAADGAWKLSATPPAGNINLVLEGASERFASYIDHNSTSWTGRTVEFWLYLVVPPSVGIQGAWRQMRFDCDAKMRAENLTFAIRASGAITTGQPPQSEGAVAITEDSMDESLFQVLCEGESFNWNRPAVDSASAATLQGREVLKTRFGVE